MKCPFCAEEIKDEAVICRFCQQNLILYKTFEQRLSNAENSIEQVITAFNELAGSVHEFSGNISKNVEGSTTVIKTPWKKIIIAAFIPIITTAILAFIMETNKWYESRLLFYSLSILSSIPTALWVGITWPKSHFLAYLLTGLVIGVVSTLTVALIFKELPPVNLYLYLIAPPTFMFLTGGLFGDVIERKIYPNRAQTGFADKIAKRFYVEGLKSGREQNSSSIWSEEKAKKLAGFISALAPILALIGTIITAVLTYLATAKK